LEKDFLSRGSNTTVLFAFGRQQIVSLHSLICTEKMEMEDSSSFFLGSWQHFLFEKAG